MNNSLNTPNSSLRKGRCKDSYFLAQEKAVYKYLFEHTATASMACRATGIPQKNFTRYKRKLELNGKLWEVKTDVCQVTGFKAAYITTNPETAKQVIVQLKLL